VASFSDNGTPDGLAGADARAFARRAGSGVLNEHVPTRLCRCREESLYNQGYIHAKIASTILRARSKMIDGALRAPSGNPFARPWIGLLRPRRRATHLCRAGQAALVPFTPPNPSFLANPEATASARDNY